MISNKSKFIKNVEKNKTFYIQLPLGGRGANIFKLPFLAQKYFQVTKILRVNQNYSFKPIFIFKFDPDPNLTPKMCFFKFFQIGNFGQFCSQISSVALCVELTEFFNNLFKMPIFQLKSNISQILKVNLVKNSKRL